MTTNFLAKDEVEARLMFLTSMCPFLIGEFHRNGDDIDWYYEIDYINEDEDPADELWDVHCAVSAMLERIGYAHKDSWADNDSCGFTVIKDE